MLCEKKRVRGSCRTVDRDTPLLGNILRGITIQSMRPVGGSGGDPHPPANDQSVRGNFAEFHTQPTTRGVRVLACTGSATANCAARSADNWCRSRTGERLVGQEGGRTCRAGGSTGH